MGLELGVRRYVQPVTLATDVDDDLVGLQHGTAAQPPLDHCRGAGALDQARRLLVEVNQRTFAQRDTQLILEIVTDAPVGQQLVLREIDCMSLDRIADTVSGGSP